MKLTLREAEEQFDINVSTLIGAIRYGHLPAERIGYVWYVEADDVKAFARRRNRYESDVPRAAEALGVKEWVIRRWCRQGKFPHAKRVWRYWRIPDQDIQAMLAEA